MIRHQILIFGRFFQPKVLYSTAMISNKEGSRTLIHKLSAEYEDISPIMNILEKKNLNNIHFEEWKSRISQLKLFYFTDRDCFKMISKYPGLLQMPLDKIRSSTEQWFAADLGFRNFHILLINQPVLIEVEDRNIRKRVPELRTLFRTTTALVELLTNSPNVMYDDWNEVKRKINYLVTVKGFKMGDIVQSVALSKSLNYIKLRLDLLEKCGIYKQDNTAVHKRNLYDKSKYVNPTLKSILNAHFTDFIKTAKISSEEYAVFKDYFMENNDDDDDDDEDDDEDDDIYE